MELEKVFHSEQCSAAPDASHLVIADVRGSTQLIRQGRQRDVNLVGAACIAAIRNLFPPGRVPYVFGGDGATFLVEADDLVKCMEALTAVQNMARRNLKISLRLGGVSVEEIRAKGADVMVGTVQAGIEESMSCLHGDGIILADQLVKARDTRNDETRDENNIENAKIDGLSCRVMPFESQRGGICALVIEALKRGPEKDALFQELQNVLKTEGNIERFCPVRSNAVRHRWISSQWKSEAALYRPDTSFSSKLKMLGEFLLKSLMTNYVFVFNKANSVTGLPSRYLQELPEQSDWIKVNGALYLVLDMTVGEERDICRWLKEKEKLGELRFGMQKSSAAILTCHLHSSSQHRHFHFVDSTEGGLTAAATHLKSKKQRHDS